MLSRSYTTVRVDQDGTTRIDVMLCPDEQASLWCVRDRAQLVIKHGHADVTILASDPTAPTAEDVRVARKLAGLFARYAAEVERLHTRTSAADHSGECAA